MSAPERCLDVANVMGIDPDIGDIEPSRRPQGARDVLSPDRAAEAVWRIVGQRQRLLLSVEAMHGQHRPEHLFSRNASFCWQIDEHGWIDIEALVGAAWQPANRRSAPFFQSQPDVLKGLVVLTA